MSFHSPQAFWLFIPLLVIIYWNFRSNKKRASVLFSSLATLKQVSPGLKAKLAFAPGALKYLAAGLLIVGIARPQVSDTLVRKNVEGIDIMVALDISDSMLVEDMKPNNRMEAAKDTLRRFVEKRVSDRIGVVIFAGESFTVVPLTLDYQLLVDRISEVTTAQQARIKDGTAIGVALANAAGKLKESTAKSRVIIFMTDGENNSGTIDPLTALDVAKGYGIKIYTIGIGQDGPTRIPVYHKDAFGNKVKTYQPFESTINENLLQKMAEETGGKYYRASREDSLNGIFSEINGLEKTQIDVNKYTRFTEKFADFVGPALAIYLLSLLLSYTWLRRNP